MPAAAALARRRLLLPCSLQRAAWLHGSAAHETLFFEEVQAAPAAAAPPAAAAAAAAAPAPRTVCVLHGLLGTGRNLRGVIQDLCRQAADASGQPWRALLLDLRCHGRSARSGLPPPHTLAAAAHDVVRLWCQQLGGRAPDVLVGHSMGGKTALEVVRQLAHPGAPTGQPQQASGRRLAEVWLQCTVLPPLTTCLFACLCSAWY